jgi:hypothetical protein
LKFTVSPAEPFGSCKWGLILEYERATRWGIFAAVWRWIFVFEVGRPLP